MKTFSCSCLILLPIQPLMLLAFAQTGTFDLRSLAGHSNCWCALRNRRLSPDRLRTYRQVLHRTVKRTGRNTWSMWSYVLSSEKKWQLTTVVSLLVFFSTISKCFCISSGVLVFFHSDLVFLTSLHLCNCNCNWGFDCAIVICWKFYVITS